MIMLILSSLTAIIVPSILFLLAWVISARNLISREKSSPFECGFDPNHTARLPFSMRFFLLAIIFIVFDIEIVLLIPIPILLLSTNMSIIMVSSLAFLTILILGLIHEWNEGALNWAS